MRSRFERASATAEERVSKAGGEALQQAGRTGKRLCADGAFGRGCDIAEGYCAALEEGRCGVVGGHVGLERIYTGVKSEWGRYGST
jgi:hypothetical protein